MSAEDETLALLRRRDEGTLDDDDRSLLAEAGVSETPWQRPKLKGSTS